MGTGVRWIVPSLLLGPIGERTPYVVGLAYQLLAIAGFMALAYPLWRFTPRPGSREFWLKLDAAILGFSILLFALTLVFPAMGVDIWMEVVRGGALVGVLYACLDRVRLRGFTAEAWGKSLLGIAFVAACIGVLIHAIYQGVHDPSVIFLTRWAWWKWL